MIVWDIRPTGRREFFADKLNRIPPTRQGASPKSNLLVRFMLVVSRNQEPPNVITQVAVWTCLKSVDYDQDLKEARQQIVAFFKVPDSAIKVVGVDITAEQVNPGYSALISEQDAGSQRYQSTPGK